MFKMLRCRSALIAIVCCLCLGSVSFAADLQRVEIPAGDLGAALQALTKQTGIELVYQSEAVKGLKTKGVSGTFSPVDALTKLLEGTGLKLNTDSTGAMLIAPPQAARGSSNGAVLSAVDADGATRLARADTGAQSQLMPENTQNNKNQSTASLPSEEGKENGSKLEEVVVTGTHIRGSDPLSPLTTITGEDIVRQGYTRLDEVIAQLPQSFGGGVVQGSNGFTQAGQGADLNQTLSSGVNLRGLGPGTTLVLLNGQRLAYSADGTSADISTIPTSIIDRVEILTDGASATYGSDAIGGVVNIITKKDFSGFETDARVSSISAGKTPNYGGYLLGGTDWNTGNLVLSYNYEEDNPLLARNRSWASTVPDPTDLIGKRKMSSFYGLVRQDVGSSVTIDANTFYSDRSYYTVQNYLDYLGIVPVSGTSKQLAASSSITYKPTANWTVSATGQDSRSDETYSYTYPTYSLSNTTLIDYRLDSGALEADGKLLSLPGGPLSLALGAEYRSEAFKYPGGEISSASRSITSANAELLVPIVGDANSLPFVRSLQIDVSGRYDRYTDFGASTNPKVALKWEVGNNLTVHGSYGTSFRAPTFFEEYFPESGYIYPVTDASSPTGTRNALLIDGGNSHLKPETARTLNVGIDFTPLALAPLKFALSYFDINYTNRIVRPESEGFFTNVVTNSAELGSLINLNPTPAEVAAASAGVPPNNLVSYIGPYSNADVKAIADIGYVNAASSKVEGLDLDVRYQYSPRIGAISVDWDSSYFTRYDEQLTPSAPLTSVLNTPYNPLAFRSKLNANYSLTAWSFNSRLNFSNAYHNPGDPGCIQPRGCAVSSWTTVDISATYKTPENLAEGALRDLRVTLSISNLFDQAPPRVVDGTNPNLLYDPTNANSLGRAASIEVSKRW